MGIFAMPSLGADMEAGTLMEWLVQVGDEVKRGDIIAVVETEKGAIEVEIFETGEVSALLLQPGATVPVGTPMAEIGGAGLGVTAPAGPGLPAGPALERSSAPETTKAKPPAAAKPPPRAPSVREPARAGAPRASPAARKRASETGIDLAKLKGSGPQGAIISSDVEAALASAPPGTPVPPEAAPKRRGIDFAEMRKAIGAAMARSKREIPHYYLQHTVDLHAAQAWIARTNAERDPPERLLMAALFLKAAALALKKYPEFNGHFLDGAFKPSEAVHLGVAIAIRGGGLIAPAVHDADGLALDALMAALRDITARMREGRVRSSELSDPTATVSSLGERGAESLFGVIYPPQVALIGFGAPRMGVAAIAEAVGVRPLVTVTVAGDHRANDGHRGGLLLKAIEQLLQTPEAL